MSALSLPWLLLLLCPIWTYPACPRLAADETVRVERVVDGDTLKLKDGRTIRLIGIDTPELNPYDRTQAEPGATHARDWLRNNFKKGSQLKLVFGVKKHDDYGRWLAHPLWPSGAPLTEQMLLLGLGSLLLIAPNHELWPCLFAAETKARRARRGIWSRPLSMLPSQTGWQMLRGRVTAVSTESNRVRLLLEDKVWLQAGSRSSPELRLRLAQIRPGTLLFVRGWVYRDKGEWRLWLNRPWQYSKEN
ncbi:thermonuclease family protein [Zobellella maritima]|uniref:thermonuclease family protein n=1 Tax=Zobellella maritima TaxID=2059725 RepID=UPI000E305333|nr:thermonuclease family protein [Zobellella maritima]